MEYVVLKDTSLLFMNRGRRDNESTNIIYRDKRGAWHTIDFDICAENFRGEHEKSSGSCIGERKRDENYFVFYTSGIKTKIIFKKRYVRNIFSQHLLCGSSASRFRALQELIDSTKYSTFDLS